MNEFPNKMDEKKVQTCRTCLDECTNDSLRNLFTEYSGVLLGKALMTVAPIQISEEDLLPQFICTECVNKLENALAFQKQCVNSDERLRDKFTFDLMPVPTDKNDIDNIPDSIKQEQDDGKSSGGKHSDTDDSDVDLPEQNADDKGDNPRQTSKSLKCDVCNSSFNSRNSLRTHKVRQEHFNEKEALLRHLKKIGARERIQQLKMETEQAMWKKPKNFRCTVCGHFYLTHKNLWKHKTKKDHFTEDERNGGVKNDDSCAQEKIKYPCPMCSKEFKKKQAVRDHVISLHQDPSFECEKCGKKFSKRVRFDVHMRSHTGEVVATCQFCGRGFRDMTYLNRHVLSHLPKSYHCDYCNRPFALLHAMKRHRRIHTGERPYSCDICQKSFNRDHILKLHKMSHTDERPHKCTVCPKAFRTRQLLRFHYAKHGPANDTS